MEVAKLIQEQRIFFASGQSLSLEFRKKQLKNLQEAISKYSQEIEEALFTDLRKHNFEAFLTEVANVQRSLKHTIKQVDVWAKPQRVRSSMINFPSKDYLIPEPYGLSLIISPWNYPFSLCIEPLIAAISAGNCVIIKPSELSPASSAIVKKIIEKVFDSRYVAVVEGGVDVTQELLSNRFDKYFFTGSTQVGKIVYQAAAQHLASVTLELGGKSPCIVSKSAKLDLAAKRIIWGKFINAGQTCIAPDYIYVHNSVKQQFIEELKRVIIQFYSTDIGSNLHYTRIINKKHFDRLNSLIMHDKLVFGGRSNIDDLYIEPTIMDNVTWDDAVMQEEIFGPILPIMGFDNLENAVSEIKRREKPLAFYLFSNDKKEKQYIQTHCQFGGGCINDTISHIVNDRLPFGGVGHSGLGAYHGKFGFDCFSHHKSVLHRGTWFDPILRYPPYTEKTKKVIQWLVKLGIR